MSFSRRHFAAPVGFVVLVAGGAMATGGARTPSPAQKVAAVRAVAAPAFAGPGVALTVGGGPTPEYNQVAIESNVRYVDSLLPAATPRYVLFAGGDKTTATVQYQDTVKATDAEIALRYVLGESDEGGPIRYRAPRLPRLDGPSRRATVAATFDKLATGAKTSPAAPGSAPYLLYFTGHGSQNERNLDNNTYELWNKEEISVRDLAGEIAKFPKTQPVTLVMVQCFSGAFGNLLFENGDPQGRLTDRPLCGFFAATRERPAAGCTPEVNEADYHDFTGYFFAALTGKGRTGNTIAPPDYDKDGKVGMNEAFAYALITEPSMDVPVATSDVFLRRFAPVKTDKEIVATPWESVRMWASPAQKAALDGLSVALSATGPDRLKTALQEVTSRYADGERNVPLNITDNSKLEAAQATLQAGRQTLGGAYPALLQRRDRDARKAARAKALAYLGDRPQLVAKLKNAGAVYKVESDAQYKDSLNGARWLRFLRLAKSVVLEHRLRAGADKTLIARLDKLQALEAQNPLRPALTPAAAPEANAARVLDTRPGA